MVSTEFCDKKKWKTDFFLDETMMSIIYSRWCDNCVVGGLLTFSIKKIHRCFLFVYLKKNIKECAITITNLLYRMDFSRITYIIEKNLYSLFHHFFIFITSLWKECRMLEGKRKDKILMQDKIRIKVWKWKITCFIHCLFFQNLIYCRNRILCFYQETILVFL
jgi:hypothetical protein